MGASVVPPPMLLSILQDAGPIGIHQQRALDSTVAHPELDDPVIRLVQWIFQRPPWVMWGGAILAGIVAALLAWQLWRHRRAIGHWLATRRLGAQFALAAAAIAALVAIAGLGYRANNFVMRDNRFCNGCHIFVSSGEAAVLPDTGSYSLVNQLEGKHDTLSCHACHTLRPLKEAVKMVYWMSGVRDREIPPHARVPRDVCERCHVTGRAKETWQAIAATAGHRTHLESDSSALKGKVECLTCHAQSAHRFVPANATCAQRGCHATASVRIRLGRMASQTSTHCIVCHRFTAEVPALATRDSAAHTLIPRSEQCFSCHQMRGRLAEFVPGQDPHNATCGMCHDPHKQTEPAAAAATCSTAGCHGDWRKIPFHTGAAHRAVASSATRCVTCHVPHQARVDGSDCVGCHTGVRERSRGARQPPLPFDTTRVLRTFTLRPVAPAGISPPPEHPPHGLGDAPPGDPVESPRPPQLTPAAAPSAAADSFSHARHRRLQCLTCHRTTSRRSALTFERPRGCQLCHHQAPASSRCVSCHDPDETGRPRQVELAVAVGNGQPTVRTAVFQHSAHASRACGECHTEPVTLAPSPGAAACRDCHDAHHARGPSCPTCHAGPDIQPAHRVAANAHAACDDCHAPATVARLVPTRALCLTCHQSREAHYPTRECTTCHFQSSPEGYRRHLLKASAS